MTDGPIIPATEAPPIDPSPQLKDLRCCDEDAQEGEDDITPKIGMTFKNYGEACYYYKQYAQRTGFGATVRNSLYGEAGECTRLVLACSKCRKSRGVELYSMKTNCPASIRLKLKEDKLLHLVDMQLDHNHPLNPGMKERCYRKLASKAVPREELCHELIREDDDVHSFQREGKSSTQRGCLKLRRGSEWVITEFFMRMQSKSGTFFYLVDLDQEGQMRNVFWADPLARAAYQYFGDVVSFGTTCFIDKGDTNLVLFLGINHHGQAVLLGCGLLSDETTETFIWLFKAWLACMSGRPPNAIITDQCNAIQDAVVQVFPEARHRFCLSNLMRKFPGKIRGFGERDAIRQTFKKVVYDSLRADEFENNWRDMIEKFGLDRSEWFSLLYEKRHYWVPVFLRDTFWAGMCNTQWCRVMAKFFDGFVGSESSLDEFIKKYEAALQSKYEKEAQADYESLLKTRPFVSKFYMEEQLSKLYTCNMFWKFQDELKATMYCDVALLGMDGIRSTFIVKESVFLEDGSESEIKEYEVMYHENEAEVQCICGLFNSQGILCRHALSVLKLHQVYEIPSQYVVSRWRKDYRWLHASVRSSNDFPANSVMERYGDLSSRCLQLVDMGVVSDEKYDLALELIGEVRKHLLDDSRSGNVHQESICLKSRLYANNEGRTIPKLGTSNGNKVADSSQAKRRGLPPKKRKLPGGEAIDVSNNDPSEALLAGNRADILQAVTTNSLPGRHNVAHGGINLMENATINDFSFGSHSGGNIQHHGDTQFGMQFNKVIQGQFGQQTIANRLTPQPISEEDQLPRAPPGWTIGY